MEHVLYELGWVVRFLLERATVEFEVETLEPDHFGYTPVLWAARDVYLGSVSF